MEHVPVWGGGGAQPPDHPGGADGPADGLPVPAVTGGGGRGALPDAGAHAP